MGWDIPLGCGVRTQLSPLLLGLTGTELTLPRVLCSWSESSIGAAPMVPQIPLGRGQWQDPDPIPPKSCSPLCVPQQYKVGKGKGDFSQKYVCPPSTAAGALLPKPWLKVTL